MIVGKKVQLRAIEQSDISLYYQWINDTESNSTRGLYHPLSLDGAKAWINAESQHSETKITFMIQTKEGKPIGLIGFKNICPRSRRGEIWIYIGEKGEWGHGYGYDSLVTLTNYGFEDLNMYRVWLEADHEYSHIIEMYKRVGFVFEGRLRGAYYRHGNYRDTCIMSILRNEWEDLKRKDK